MSKDHNYPSSHSAQSTVKCVIVTNALHNDKINLLSPAHRTEIDDKFISRQWVLHPFLFRSTFSVNGGVVTSLADIDFVGKVPDIFILHSYGLLYCFFSSGAVPLGIGLYANLTDWLFRTDNEHWCDYIVLVEALGWLELSHFICRTSCSYLFLSC